MSRVDLTLGPPGTGKTTRMLDKVETALVEGVPPQRIAFTSFTRKAAKEAIDRASSRFGVDPGDFIYFRTAHSLCFHQLGLTRDQVMGTEHYRQMGTALGVSFHGMYDEHDGPLPLYGDALGDLAMRCDALSRLRMRPLKQQWQDMAVPELPWLAAEQFSETLKAYKRDTGLLDFTDMLERFNRPLPVDRFIIDEAQDNAAAVWRVLIEAARTAEKIEIAGDDDQAIFRWAGADLGFFLSLKGNRNVLPHSHRLPKAIYLLAERIINRIGQRYSKSWTPRDDCGSIEYLGDIGEAPVGNGESWLLLARNVYQLKKLEKVVRDQGYAYLLHGKNSVGTAEVRAILAYEHLRQGNAISLDQARQVVRFCTPARLVDRGGLDFRASDLGIESLLHRDWMEALDLISVEEREYVRACKRNGVALNQLPRINISTIHGVKGGEADNVAILPDLSHRTWQSMQFNADDECRVFYVGVTRAIKRLWLARPQTLKYFPLC